MRTLLISVLCACLPALTACRAQQTRVDRPPAVAGSFYPADSAALARTVDGLLQQAAASPAPGVLRALIVPHAGYVYSGAVAARGFVEIDPAARYDRVILLGASHTTGFRGASVYAAGDFLTPLGRVEVDAAAGDSLRAACPLVSARSDAHAREHCLEVELPFLQRRLRAPFRILPLILGSNSAADLRRIADALRPFFTTRSLVVVSTDFSHYPGAAEAARVDGESAAALCANRADTLRAMLRRHEATASPALATDMCGASAVLALLMLTEGEAALRFSPLLYRNSGAAPGADTGRVVGYWAIAVREITPETADAETLTQTDRRALLVRARETLTRMTAGGGNADTPTRPSPELALVRGAFVTLWKHGALRGCIGNFRPDVPLQRLVETLAVSAATEDPRFEPVTADEIPELEIEISVLTPMRRVASADEITLGRHGVYLRKGARAGTFLPQVAEETGWSKEEFLGHLARDKAGLRWDDWRDAELSVYEALVFREADFPDLRPGR